MMMKTYVTEMLKPAVFAELAAENLLNDSSIHLFCKSTDHAFPKPKRASVTRGHLGNRPPSSARRVSPTSHDSRKDDMDEYNFRLLSLRPSQLDSNAYAVSHLQNPLIKETVRIIIRSYIKHCPSLSNAFEKDEVLSRSILAVAATFVSFGFTCFISITYP
jgi:hypothetical protein